MTAYYITCVTVSCMYDNTKPSVCPSTDTSVPPQYTGRSVPQIIMANLKQT